MKTLKLLGILVLVTFASACDSVSSVHPLGADTVQLVGDEWEGTWILQDGALELNVIDAKAGIIEVAYIEHDKVERHTIHIRESGKDSYMNVLNEEKRYYFAKFKKRDNQIIVWPPSLEAMETAIASKAIKGEIIASKAIKGEITKEDDLIIDDLIMIITADKNSLNQYFADNREKMLFEYDDPLVFRKNVE